LDKLWEFVLAFVRLLLLQKPSGPPLRLSKGIAVASCGGLVGGYLVVGLMGWLSPTFTIVLRPLSAMARGTFSGLLCGVIGAVGMSLLSIKISRSSVGERIAWSTVMCLAGGTILLSAHVLGAETQGEQKLTVEWVAMFAHGALASVTAVNMVNFFALPGGLRCLLVALLSGLVGSIGYGGVTRGSIGLGYLPWRELETSRLTRGTFVTVATVVYVTSLLFSLLIARIGESRFREALVVRDRER
jgi:hypothetical protein